MAWPFWGKFTPHLGSEWARGSVGEWGAGGCISGFCVEHLSRRVAYQADLVPGPENCKINYI